MPSEYTAVDVHVGGAPVRLLVGGVPTPEGASLEKRRAWLSRRADQVRRATMLEPRGHRDLAGALFTEAVSPAFDAGLLFLAASGYPSMHPAGVVAATTIALERGYITKEGLVPGSVVPLSFDTPAGPVAVRAHTAATAGGVRVERVVLSAGVSFVIAAGHEAAIGGRRFPVDLVWAGALVAVVDGEAAGVSLQKERTSELRRCGRQVAESLEGAAARTQGLPGAGGVLVAFTGPPHGSDSHIRSVPVSASGALDRSSGLAALPAVATVLHAMELLGTGHDLVAEGLYGLTQRCRVTGRVDGHEQGAVFTETESTAWIISEQLLLVSDDDPFVPIAP